MQENLLEQFSAGYHSVHMVAEKVIMSTKHNDDGQCVWKFQAPGSLMSICNTKIEQLGREIKNLVKKQTEFISYPISLWIKKRTHEISDDEDKAKKEKVEVSNEWELINKQKPHGLDKLGEVIKGDYAWFYKRLTNKGKDHLLVNHFLGKRQLEFKKIAENKEDRDELYGAFSKNLQLRVYENIQNRDNLANSLRFYSKKSRNEMISLTKYIIRMKDGQMGVYYIGESKGAVKRFPSRWGNKYNRELNEEKVLQYARVIISCATVATGGQKRALVVGSGINNFTDVAATFKALFVPWRKKKSKLQAKNMHIFVRKGYPSYQIRLAQMQGITQSKGEILVNIVGNKRRGHTVGTFNVCDLISPHPGATQVSAAHFLFSIKMLTKILKDDSSSNSVKQHLTSLCLGELKLGVDMTKLQLKMKH